VVSRPAEQDGITWRTMMSRAHGSCRSSWKT
jgi:hypothetical protein